MAVEHYPPLGGLVIAHGGLRAALRAPSRPLARLGAGKILLGDGALLVLSYIGVWTLFSILLVLLGHLTILRVFMAPLYKGAMAGVLGRLSSILLELLLLLLELLKLLLLHERLLVVSRHEKGVRILELDSVSIGAAPRSLLKIFRLRGDPCILKLGRLISASAV